MVSTLLHLGDSCKRCGESVQTHLQNPFGVRIAVYSPRYDKTDYIICNRFVDGDGNPVSRDDLFRRTSSS